MRLVLLRVLANECQKLLNGLSFDLDDLLLEPLPQGLGFRITNFGDHVGILI